MQEKSQSNAWRFRWEIGTLVIGTLGGIATAAVTDQAALCVISGTLITILLLLFRDLWEQRRAESDTCEKLQQLCDALGKRESATAKHLMALQWSVKEIEAAKMPEIWNSLLWLFDETYHATNHSLSYGQTKVNFYSEHFAKSALELQTVKIKLRHASVRRVMIVDSAAELAKIVSEMKKQSEEGMEVKYIFWSELRSRNAPLNPERAGLASEDFGIFDGKYVLVWKNHPKTGQVTGGKLVCDEQEVQAYKAYYKQIFESSYAMRFLQFVELDEKLKAQVQQWGPYPDRFSEYNYALAQKTGWLDDQGAASGARRFAALSVDGVDSRTASGLIGFSMLVPTGDAEAEFYVTVAPDLVGRGFGYAITLQTLAEGFERCGFERIHLKVRTWNERARNVYRNLGFTPISGRERGKETINGQNVELEYMQITKDAYLGDREKSGIDPMVARFTPLDV